MDRTPAAAGKVAYGDRIKNLMNRYQPYKHDFDDIPFSKPKLPDRRKIIVKSIDTFELMGPIELTCPSRNLLIESNIIYINPCNHQVYFLCPLCKTPGRRRDWKAWHLIKDHEIRNMILDDLSINHDKYKKGETEENILWLVRDYPGINHYQISQDLEMTKGQTRRGVARLKKKHLVRTRRVGKAICVYPIVDIMGTDFTI